MTELSQTRPGVPGDRFEQLCFLYCNGEIDPVDFDELCEALDSDSACRSLFVRIAMQVEAMRELYDAEAEEAGSLDTTADDDAVLNEVIDAALASRKRQEIERQAEAALRLQQAAEPGPARQAGPVGRSGPRVIVIPKIVAWGALAAAVVLAASSWYVLRPDPVTTEPVAEQPAPPAIVESELADASPVEPEAVPAPVVATLSATHQAQWQIDPQAAEPRVPQVGDALTAGQRLVLTAGHAQLTTARGAVAILEAPCTIELTDSPNAIGLVQGKLVGIVETEQAKGFLVTTPQMSVTDLGTRFGVSCSGRNTQVRVLEGKVQAAPVADDSAKHTVSAGQSVAAADGARWVSILAEPGEQFVLDWQAVAVVPELTGDIRYEPAMPSDLRLGRYTDAKILIFHERSAVDLRSPITVNNYVPGRFVNEQLLETTQLAPAVVDSYLIHLDTPNIAGAGSARTATITFDRPVLGIIGSSDALAQSHDILGQPGVRYGSMSAGNAGRFSGLDVSEKQPEIIEISEDRKTLTLRLSALDGMDQARILVASKLEP